MPVCIAFVVFLHTLLDPYEDQFEKLTKTRNERRAKNEFARLKNISRVVKEGHGNFYFAPYKLLVFEFKLLLLVF